MATPTNIPTDTDVRERLDELAGRAGMSRAAFLAKLVELAGESVAERLSTPIRMAALEPEP